MSIILYNLVKSVDNKDKFLKNLLYFFFLNICAMLIQNFCGRREYLKKATTCL